MVLVPVLVLLATLAGLVVLRSAGSTLLSVTSVLLVLAVHIILVVLIGHRKRPPFSVENGRTLRLRTEPTALRVGSKPLNHHN